MEKQDKAKFMTIALVALTIANVIAFNLKINIGWKAALVAAILTACFALGQWVAK